MTSIKKQIRTNQALKVIKHSNDGMSIIEACHVVGIARSTFYYFCNTNYDAINSFQEMQLRATAQELILILDNSMKVLERLIQDSLSDKTKPRQRLAIYKELTKRLDELVADAHYNQSGFKGDADFLTGPELVLGESRFSS